MLDLRSVLVIFTCHGMLTAIIQADIISFGKSQSPAKQRHGCKILLGLSGRHARIPALFAHPGNRF